METGGTARTRTAQKTLEDHVYMTPVDLYQARFRRRVVIGVLVVLAVAAYRVLGPG